MKLARLVFGALAVVTMLGICDEATAAYRCRVTAQSLYVRPRAGSYAQGKLYNGHAFDVQYVDGNNWAYGYAYGYVNRCGWSQRGYMAQNTEGANTYCRSSPTAIADSEFMCPGTGPYGSVNDGQYWNATCGIYVWDNYIHSAQWGNHNYRGYFGPGSVWMLRYITQDCTAWMARWGGVSDWSFLKGCY